MRLSTSIYKVAVIFDSLRLRPSMGVTELARNTHLLPSDVHRIVTSLKHFGYVDQDGETKQYRLGLELLRLGHLVYERISILEVAKPFLFRLSRMTDATANLAIFVSQARQVIFVDQVDFPPEAQIKSRIGTVTSPQETSAGKVLMAYMDPLMAEHDPQEHELTRGARNTALQKLRLEFETIRAGGYAIDSEERPDGACSVSAPVRDHRGEVVAAVSISRLDFRMNRPGEQRLVRAVKEIGGQISAALGYGHVRLQQPARIRNS